MTKLSKSPVITKSVSGYSWRINPTYRIDNDKTMLSSYAFKHEDGSTAYEHPERIPKYIKKQIERMHELTNHYYN